MKLYVISLQLKLRFGVKIHYVLIWVLTLRCGKIITWGLIRNSLCFFLHLQSSLVKSNISFCHLQDLQHFLSILIFSPITDFMISSAWWPDNFFRSCFVRCFWEHWVITHSTFYAIVYISLCCGRMTRLCFHHSYYIFCFISRERLSICILVLIFAAPMSNIYD